MHQKSKFYITQLFCTSDQDVFKTSEQFSTKQHQNAKSQYINRNIKQIYIWYCGSNVQYSINTVTYKTTISVSGPMADYQPKSLPFHASQYVISVSISDSVASIGNYAFYSCTYLVNIAIPNSVTSIGNSTFYYCVRLTSIALSNRLTSIGIYDFIYCVRLTSVTLSNRLTSIGIYDFIYCYSLTSITIPNSVTSIGNSVFSQCSNLTSITILNNVTSIGNLAFSRCSSLIDANYLWTKRWIQNIWRMPPFMCECCQKL